MIVNSHIKATISSVISGGRDGNFDHSFMIRRFYINYSFAQRNKDNLEK